MRLDYGARSFPSPDGPSWWRRGWRRSGWFRSKWRVPHPPLLSSGGWETTNLDPPSFASLLSKKSQDYAASELHNIHSPPHIFALTREMNRLIDLCTNTGDIHRFLPFLHLNPQIDQSYSPNQVMAL